VELCRLVRFHVEGKIEQVEEPPSLRLIARKLARQFRLETVYSPIIAIETILEQRPNGRGATLGAIKKV
jgi:hypothetical protein